VSAYSDPSRAPKQHELAMLDRIAAHYPHGPESVLDIGCADALFLAMVAARWPEARCRGIDASLDMVEAGSDRLRRRGNVSASVSWCRAEEYSRQAFVDPPWSVIVASGILGCMEDACAQLERWLGWLDPVGRLFLFGRFNSSDIDVEIQHRTRDARGVLGAWQRGLSAMSRRTIDEAMGRCGYSVDWRRFKLGMRLAGDPADPLRSFTHELATGEHLVLNGANTVAEHWFATIWRSRRDQRGRTISPGAPPRVE